MINNNISSASECKYYPNIAQHPNCFNKKYINAGCGIRKMRVDTRLAIGTTFSRLAVEEVYHIQEH